MNITVKDHRPLVDAKIYPAKRRQGRYARLLVFVTVREMQAYIRSTGVTPGRYTRAMCLDFTVIPGAGLCFAEIVFSAGFRGRANEIISHECLHALMRLRTDAEVVSALYDQDKEELLLAYPLGRMVARICWEIHKVEDSLAFYPPRGNALKAMRRVARDS